MHFFGLVPCAGLDDHPLVMEPLRRLSDRDPLPVVSQSRFLGRRSCPSISSSSPSASISRSGEGPLESEVLSPFACSKAKLATGSTRELAAAAYGVRPECRGVTQLVMQVTSMEGEKVLFLLPLLGRLYCLFRSTGHTIQSSNDHRGTLFGICKKDSRVQLPRNRTKVYFLLSCFYSRSTTP